MITSDMLPSNDMIFDMIDVNSHETVSIKSFDLNVEKPELDDILKTDTESKEILMKAATEEEKPTKKKKNKKNKKKLS